MMSDLLCKIEFRLEAALGATLGVLLLFFLLMKQRLKALGRRFVYTFISAQPFCSAAK